MIIFVGLLILLLVVVLAIWLTANLIGLVITLLLAGLIGWLADLIVPGRLPYGLLGAIVAGLLGSWVGGILLGDYGLELRGIALIPALVGATILAFAARFVGKSSATG